MFAAAAIATLAGGAQLVGCGDSDDSTSPQPVDDAGTEPSDAGAVTTGPTLTVSDARAKIYLGQTAKIDGASVAPGITTGISWKVLSAPFGSAITAASLQDATTASPTFKPDLLGGYTLQINGSKNGAPASVIVFIEAIDAPVFWREGHITGSDNFTTNATIAVTTHVGGVYAAGDRAVNCAPDAGGPDGGPNPSSSAEIAVYGARLSASAGDVWEAPPGSPSRVAFVDATLVGGGFPSTSLSVATSQSSCGSPEAKALETLTVDVDAGDGTPMLSLVQNARFSPSGNRIAYLHDVNGKARLSTIAFDGTAKRELAPFYATGSDAGSLDPDAGTVPGAGAGPLPLGQVTPRWKDETHVGWITFVGPDANEPQRSEWDLYVVEDTAGASASRVMHCALSSPTNFDFLPDGTIVAATRHLVSTPDGDQPTMDLLVYRANATTGECEIARNLTNNTTSDAVARDLAVSPDKSQIAFFSGIGTGFGFDPNNNLALFTVPVDGSHAAAQVPGTDRGADPGVGPRWVAGGTAITWGQINSLQGNNGSLGRLVSVAVGGGTSRTVTSGSANETPDGDGGRVTDYRITYGIGQGCGISHGPLSSGVMAAGGALGFAALVARRRRRRAPKA